MRRPYPESSSGSTLYRVRSTDPPDADPASSSSAPKSASAALLMDQPADGQAPQPESTSPPTLTGLLEPSYPVSRKSMMFRAGLRVVRITVNVPRALS